MRHREPAKDHIHQYQGFKGELIEWGLCTAVYNFFFIHTEWWPWLHDRLFK